MGDWGLRYAFISIVIYFTIFIHTLYVGILNPNPPSSEPSYTKCGISSSRSPGSMSMTGISTMV